MYIWILGSTAPLIAFLVKRLNSVNLSYDVGVVLALSNAIIGVVIYNLHRLWMHFILSIS